jgi:hypothetical protein
MRKTENEMTRFLRYVRKDKSGCWLWAGGRDKFGYGVFYLRGRSMGAHRASYILHEGAVPVVGARFVCHTCDNPPCVNPTHLFLGTPADNTRDRLNKLAGIPGPFKRRPWSKSDRLNPGVKKDALEGLESVMWEFGLAPSTVGREIAGSPNFLDHVADPEKTITTSTLDKIWKYVVEKRGQLNLKL